MSKATYLVHVEIAQEGDFVVTVPKLPGCRASAATFEQALDAAKTTIERHLNALVKGGQSIPVESSAALPMYLQVEVAAPKLNRKTGRS